MIRTETVRPLQQDIVRMASVWDKVASPELAFDFSQRAPAPVPSPALTDWTVRDRVGIKEAIIRWLEEQL